MTENASTDDPRVDIQSALERASNYNGWIARQVKAHVGRRVLDAGCGSGNITNLMLDRETVVAVDVWRDFVAIMRERFAGAPHVHLHQFDLADPTMVDTLRDYELDSAYCVNVLEHIEDDRAALANIAAALVPDSPIFLLVPAFPSLYGEHDRADHHFRRYTKRSLEQTVAPLPLRVEHQRYMNLPGFFAWFALGRVLRRQLSADGIGAYDRIVPLVSRVEERVAPPFGQSLVALLRTAR